MKFNELNLYGEDGQVSATVVLGEAELKALLQFGMNMAVAMGIAADFGVDAFEGEDYELDD